MDLVTRINDDLKSAMKSKDKDKLNVIRSLKSAIQLTKISLKHDLDDSEVVDVVAKQIKMRKESIQDFEKANRSDLIESYQKEIDILSTYLPEQLSSLEAEGIIDEVMLKINPKSNKEMGKVMKEVSLKLKGVFDMSEASKIVRDKFNNL